MKQKIITTIENEIKEDQQIEALYNALLPIVEKHDGKPLGKRFMNDIKAILPKSYLGGHDGTNLITGEIRASDGYDLSLYLTNPVDLKLYKSRNTFAQNTEHSRITNNAELIQNNCLLIELAKKLEQLDALGDYFSSICSYKIPCIYRILALSRYELKERSGE